MKKRTVLIYIIMVALVCLSCFACGGGEMRIERMSFVFSSVEVSVEESKDLALVVRPMGANEEILWNSSSPSVATVENGIVTAHSKGSATITAWTNSGITTTCEICVVDYSEDNADIGVGLFVDGEIIDYVYTSEANDYLIQIPALNGNDVNGDSSFYYEGWYLDKDFTQPVYENTQFKEDGIVIYAKICDVNSQEFKYWDVEGGVAAYSYTGDDEVVIVPSTYQGKPVKELKFGLFGGNYGGNNEIIKKVVVGSNVEKIVGGAFDSPNIEEIVISASVKEIESYSFRGENNVVIVDEDNEVYASEDGALYSKDKKTIYFCPRTIKGSYFLDERIEHIGNYAFEGCKNITTIDFGSGVKSIGSSAFDDCTGLSSVFIDSLRAWMDIDFVGNSSGHTPFLYAKNLYVNGELLVDLVVPDDITEIKPYTFFSVGSLENVEFHPALTKVGKDAFCSCANLVNVIFGNNSHLEVIDQNAFNGCKKIVNLALPKRLTSIGDSAFGACLAIESLTIPDSVTSIGKRAFRRCENIKSLTIPDSVVSIGESAFSECKGLSSIDLSSSLTEIASFTFDCCDGLESFTVPSNIQKISTHAFRGCKNLRTVDIQEGVQIIDANAFVGCERLETVLLPTSLTTIGDGAFLNCRSMTFFTIPLTVTKLGQAVFAGCNSLLLYRENSALPADWSEQWQVGDDEWYKRIPIVYGDKEGVASDGNLYAVVDGVRYTLSDGKATVAYKQPLNQTEVVIPERINYKNQWWTVDKIRFNAFYKNENLTKIVIPMSVKEVGAYLTTDCPNATVYLRNGVDTSAWSKYWNDNESPVVYDYNGG